MLQYLIASDGRRKAPAAPFCRLRDDLLQHRGEALGTLERAADLDPTSVMIEDDDPELAVLCYERAIELLHEGLPAARRGLGDLLDSIAFDAIREEPDFQEIVALVAERPQ